MKKKDIIKLLNNLKIDKDKFIVIDDASLVVQDIIEQTDKIKIVCDSTDYIDDNFELIKGLHDINTIVIEGYNFSSLESCYEFKKRLNLKSDKKIIEKLDLQLCSKDNRRYEKDLYKKGYKVIAGVDEVGRGPLVGPVVACCCVLPLNFKLDGLTDSKKLSEKKRDKFYEYIKENSIYGIGVIEPEIIDEINIYEATKLAMKKAIEEVSKKIKIDHILIDAMPINLDIPTTSIIKGDLKSITIAAASVIAKVTRDKMMYDLDKEYPQYGYALHKGYPTKKHIEALNKYGLINGYRKSYGPVKDLIEKGECKWK